MRAAVGPHHPAGDQRGRPARVECPGVEHGLQRAWLGNRVVVHQPDQVGRLGQGQRQAIGEPARAAGVALRCGQPHGREAAATISAVSSVEALSTTITASGTRLCSSTAVSDSISRSRRL